MNFFKNFIIILLFTLFFIISQSFAADNNKNLVEQAKEISEEIKSKQSTTEENINSEVGIDEEEEVPLNDPFAGNEGTSTFTNFVDSDSEEAEDEMSLYKYKLVGLISGNHESYISLVNASGEVITLSLFQYLGDIKLVDLRLTEAIFQKEDKTYMIIDFNNQIRESNEY